MITKINCYEMIGNKEKKRKTITSRTIPETLKGLYYVQNSPDEKNRRHTIVFTDSDNVETPEIHLRLSFDTNIHKVFLWYLLQKELAGKRRSGEISVEDNLAAKSIELVKAELEGEVFRV